MTSVLVVGAKGVLGRRTLAWGRRHLPELRWVAGHRGAGARPDERAVDLHDSASLRRQLGDFQLLINAVGPYDYDPRAILEACAASGCHYADLAELPEFLRAAETVAKGLSEKNIAIVPGCSTTPGLLALLAQRLGAGDPPTAFDAWLAIGTRNPTSTGLVYGLLRPLGRPLPDGSRSFSRLVPRGAALYGRYPYPTSPEVVQVDGREVPLRFHVGFDRPLLMRALVASNSLWPGRSDRDLRRIARLGSSIGNLLRPFGGRTGRLFLEAKNTRGESISILEVTAFSEGLDVPAQPAAWVAGELARRGGLPGGYAGLESIVSPDSAIAWLRDSGCRVTIDGEESF